MKKYKKFIVGFLALNSMITSYSETLGVQSSGKYDRIYENIIKNINRGRPSDTSYKLIEQMLKKKNKELKDLYNQGDYIVKPEYLEWQIFFSGFYAERDKGDNTEENAERHSDPTYGTTGFYDEDGRYIITGTNKAAYGKEYRDPQAPRTVNLGVSIPIKGLSRGEVHLDLPSGNPVEINPRNYDISPPSGLVIPEINVFRFEINIPSVVLPVITTPGSFTVSVPDTGNGDDTGSYLGVANSYTAKIAQFNLTSGLLEGTWSSTSSLSAYRAVNLNGKSDYGGTTMGSRADITNYTYSSNSGDGAVALYKVGGAEKITLGTQGDPNAFIMRIISNVGDSYPAASTLPHLIQYDPHGSRGTYNRYLTNYYGTGITPSGIFDYYAELNNYGRLEGIGDSFLMIGLQEHTGNFSPTVKNYGTIIGIADDQYTQGGRRHVAFSFMAPQQHGTQGRRFEFYNMTGGKIELQARESIAFNFGASPGLATRPHFLIYNDGDVVLYGNNSVGVKTANNNLDLPYSKLVFNKPIRINGDQSIGVELVKTMDDGYGNVEAGKYDPMEAVIKVIIGDEPNSNTGDSKGDKSKVEESIGLYINKSTIDYRLGTFDFQFGEYAKRSTLINISSGKLFLDDNKVSEIFINKGIDNFGIIATGSASELTLKPNIKIGTAADNVNGTIALYGTNGAKIHLHSGNNIETNGLNSHGIILTNSNTVLDDTSSGGSNHSFTATGNESTVIYTENGASVNLANSSNIDVKATGEKSIGVYTKGGTVTLGTAGTGTGTYEIGKNGVLFYSDGTGNGRINISGTDFTVGEGSLFVRINTPSLIAGNQQINFTHNTGNTNLNLLSGGIGFVYTGDGINPVGLSDIQNYFSNNFTGISNMNVTVNKGARLFVIEKYASMNLSDIIAISSPTGLFNDVRNNGGSKAFMVRGNLVLDPAGGVINLDDINEDYNNIERALTGITVPSGVTVTGSGDRQTALVDDNSYDSTLYVKMENNGTINLTGNNSTAIYVNNGQIDNKGTVSSIGNGGIGLFGENGTVIKNTNLITIADNGVGIYGISYQDPASVPVYGGGKINITNTGIIQSNTGQHAIGIYAENNRTGGGIADSHIDLSNGKINLQNSEGAIGLYVDKGTVTDSGSEITVGKNGIGIYAKDSDITLTGTTVNLFGDNALGLYADGNTNLIGNGQINISGKNVVLFNMVSSGSITNNFVVNNVAPGSSYTLGNISGTSFEYAGSSHLSSDGTLISGKDSTILLNALSSVNANSGEINIAALIADGQYTGITPSGFTPGIEGENRGTIIMGNLSAGLIGKNNARLKNDGFITVGNNSAGMTSFGGGALLLNTKSIIIGSDSHGMYLQNGTDITNDTGGIITSAGNNSVGIYADAITGTITNKGIIRLTGDKEIGIYATGASNKIINNDGLIEIGDSIDINVPNIGIYSETAGDTFTNNGTVTSGKNSIGMYNYGDTVIQNGILNVGDTGVGAYITNGNITNTTAAQFNFMSINAIGVYALNSQVSNSALMNIGNSNYGFILMDSSFINMAPNINLGTDSVFVYRSGAGNIVNNAGTAIAMSGSDNIAYYTINGGSITNDGDIIGTAGKNNVGIYNVGGGILNNGIVAIGDSDIAYKKDSLGNYIYDVNGNRILDAENSKYAVGLYGEGSAISNSASGNITVGKGSIGIATKGGSGINDGVITGTGESTRGMYTEKGTVINNNIINITGDNAIGMAGNGAGSVVINNGTVTVTGKNVIGLYGNLATTVINSGTVIANGEGAAGIVLSQGSKLDNTASGTMIINSVRTENYGTSAGEIYETPTIINSGVIKISEKFETDGINVVIKVDPESVRKPTPEEIAAGGYDPSDSGADYLISNAVSIEAPSFTITDPLQISGNFTEGTNVKKYKLEDIIKSASGHGVNEGMVPVVSRSLTWRATPIVNEAGHVDIWMEKIDYNEFTGGLWYEEFGAALEDKYYNAAGDALTIYDKIDVIEKESDFRHVMASLAGNIYSNINQREEDMARTFENALDVIINSKNNTKENIKINIIAGKGKTKDDTDGITDYDYTTTGILALREVERTYRHTFGYSLGYLHTGFEFKDGNESEELVDTIQLGVHNKYTVNGWKLRNDLTGRVSFHNIDRNIDWPNRPFGTEREEMNGNYETYSFTSDNILGKEFSIGKQVSVMPYGAFRAMYVTRPTFSESGTERLQVEGNDAWSAKPRAGLEVKGEMPLSNKTAWKLTGKLDFAYEYELADLNERERAKLIAVEDSYHKLSKPEEEKGMFRAKALFGIEVEDRYGLFLTGEYMTGNDDQDDYRAGVTLKAVF